VRDPRSKGTIRLVATGSLPVSRLYFTLSADLDTTFSRYLYPGLTRVYGACVYSGDAFLDASIRRTGAAAVEWTMPGQDLTYSGPGTTRWASPSTAAYRFTAAGGVGAFRTFSMNATNILHDPSAPPWPPIAGTLKLTVMQ
jgi:hypothetical protein